MSGSPGTLCFRCDASPAMGHGHVMRCLALAQAWQKLQGEVCFVSHQLPEFLQQRLQAESISWHSLLEKSGTQDDASEMLSVMLQKGSSWVIVDGYHFDDGYRRQIRQAGKQVLAIDDYGTTQEADLILNQDLLVRAESYQQSESSSGETLQPLLLGGRYTLLRNEFASRLSSERRVRRTAERILVSCGGSDPCNITGTILQGLSLSSNREMEITVVLSSTHPYRHEIEQLAEQMPNAVRLLSDVADMSLLMEWADLGIVAAGSTCWEMAFMGVPVLAIVTAENQVPVAEAVEVYTLGKYVCQADQLTSELLAETIAEFAQQGSLIQEMSQRGQTVIDGRGTERIARLLHSPVLKLRPARLEDSRMLWEWRNDELVRQVSFSSDLIPFESHSVWYQKKLKCSETEILIAVNSTGDAVGQVRFDYESSTRHSAVISISVAAEHRSQGYGTAIILLATEWMLGSRRVSEVQAHIKRGNVASRKSFEKAGYQICNHSQLKTDSNNLEEKLIYSNAREFVTINREFAAAS